MQIDRANDQVAIPLAEEDVVVSKALVETGVVTVSTRVESRVERVHEMLRHSDVTIERVAIDRVVDSIPEVRVEGETLVYPVVEEVLVKRLLLREELRITRRERVEPVDQEVTLRRVHAEVERTPAPLRSPSTPQT